MKRLLAFRCLATFLLLALGSQSARAVAPVVNDRGKFFGADAVKKANEAIRDLYVNDGKDLLIETYETVATENIEKVKAMSREERLKYFEKWAKSRVEARAVRGVFVLICKDPTIIYVEVGSKATAFDETARNKLRDKLVEDFKVKKYDEGLTNAVKFVRDRLGTK